MPIFPIICIILNYGIHKEHLLALAPLINEEELGAQQHIEFIEATLALYSKTLSNIVVLIGDNCSTNRKISNDLAIPLLGCASHRFNLAVNKWIEDHPRYKSVLENIHDLMIQLCHLKNAARLRALTDLCAIKENATRWSSKYEMAKRYIRLEPHIKSIQEVEDIVLTNRERRDLDDLMIHLSKFQSITKNLQVKGCSPLTVREVFDAMIENEYPDMEHYLAPESDIVNNPKFESGLVKILARNHLSLTSEEKRAVSNLLKTTSSSPSSQGNENSETSQMGYFEELQKRKRQRLSDEQVRYVDCSFCVATSNVVERLFSACKHVLTDQRKCMSPIMFEALIFLKVNREIWDLAMVATAMKNNEPTGIERDLDILYDKW